MKVLLINPPNCGRSIPEERYGIDSIRQIFRGEPLALEVLAGNLPEHEVAILDLKADPEGLERTLAAFRPELVGFTAVTCEANTVLRLAGQVRESCGARTVVGGVQASCDPEFFNRPEIDFVVVGLGKASLAELVAALEQGKPCGGIPGVAATRPGAALSYTPRCYGPADLAEDRPPRYDLVAGYRDSYVLSSVSAKLGMVTSAFGCPYRCSFCCIAPLTGGRYLSHQVATVVRDIGLVGEVPVVRLVDANTFADVRQAGQLARAIADAGIRKHFIADVRSDTVVRHPELMRQWRQAGLRSVVIGFEEIADGELARMDKENSVALNSEAIAVLHEIGITIVGDFIVSPEYDEARFDLLERYLGEHAVDLPIITVMTPLPGTPLMEKWRERIINHDLDYYTLTNAVVPTRLEEGRFYQRYAGLLKAAHAGAKL